MQSVGKGRGNVDVDGADYGVVAIVFVDVVDDITGEGYVGHAIFGGLTFYDDVACDGVGSC